MSNEVKFIYFGSSEFSKIVLEGLCAQGIAPELVISKPDKPKGRGLAVLPTQISAFALHKGLPLLKPDYLKDSQCNDAILKHKPKFFIIVDYGKIIPASLLLTPGVFPLGVHPSLLPKYRGATPIESSILNGDKTTGITIFKVNEKVDSGDIVLQKTVDINNRDNYFTLRDKTAILSVPLAIEAIKKITNKAYKLIPQNEQEVVLTYKFKKEDGQINWNLPAFQIKNIVRAILEWPTAYTYYNDTVIKIIDVDVIEPQDNASAGTIVSLDKEGIIVATGKGSLRIKAIKPQGKNEMSAWSFVCGHKLKLGEKFS